MAFPTDGDEQNRIDESYARGHGAHSSLDIADAENNPEAPNSIDDKSSVDTGESSPNNPMNYTRGAAKPEKKKLLTKGGVFKVGGISGVILGILGIGGFGFFGQSLLLPSLSNNSFIKNDSRSTILERRLVQILDYKMSNNGPCDINKAKCKMGKMPKSMLSAMERKGITPMQDRSNKFTYSGTGYVDTNPTGYTIPDNNGGTKYISSAEFTSEYRNNPVFRKTFKGAYNMRFLGYNGKYMAKAFFDKFKLKRDGGIAADPEITEANVGEKLEEKLKVDENTKTEGGAKKTFKDRINKFFKKGAAKVKSSKGDPILMVGSAACMAINMPRFISGTYRAIQAAQVIALASDIIISPAGMTQAGHAKPEAVSALGKTLTDKPVNSDGKLGKSALDSKVLQKAIGVNKNPIDVSKYAPGYSLLSNPTIKTLNNTSDSTKGTCDAINSPQAAFAVAGIEGAIAGATAGVGGVVIGALKGLGKLAVAMGTVDLLLKAADPIVNGLADFAYEKVKDNIGNYVEGAKHEELGDALGTGILTYYSSAGLVGGAAPLSKSQVDGFTEVRAEVESDFRNEDIATLSPLDISSRYTFLGSIVSGMSLYSQPGNPWLSGVSMLSSIITSPTSIVSSTLSASTTDSNSDCGHANDFDIDEEVAVNSAGYPCVGVPKEYINMPVSRVSSLVTGDGGVNDETGEPGEKIHMMQNDCNDGDLESLKGCMITSGSSESVSYGGVRDSEGDSQSSSFESGTVGGYEAQERAAQSLYLFDYQIELILSGQDSEVSEASSYSNESDDKTDVSINNKYMETYISHTVPSGVVHKDLSLLFERHFIDQPEAIHKSLSWSDRIKSKPILEYS